MMKVDGKYNKIVLYFIEGNITAQKKYEKLKFILTDEKDGNEIVMEKVLK